MPTFSPQPKRGFTLIELMISISIMAILFAIGATTYRRAEISGRDTKRKQDIQLIASALELYYQTNKRYPTTDPASAGGWQYSTNSVPSGSSFWLADMGNSIASPTIPAKDFNTQYIAGVPLDPINKSPFVYAYFSPPATWNKCIVGRYFILYATLANINDTDRYGAAPYDACGYSTEELSWLNRTFVIIGGISK